MGTCIDNTCGLYSDATDIDISIAVVILYVHYNFCKAQTARTVYVCIQFYIIQTLTRTVMKYVSVDCLTAKKLMYTWFFLQI